MSLSRFRRLGGAVFNTTWGWDELLGGSQYGRSAGKRTVMEWKRSMYRPGSPNVAVKLFDDDVCVFHALERLANSKS
jgi:hypothetical protein